MCGQGVAFLVLSPERNTSISSSGSGKGSRLLPTIEYTLGTLSTLEVSASAIFAKT
jgi:hypothetical protein